MHIGVDTLGVVVGSRIHNKAIVGVNVSGKVRIMGRQVSYE